MRSVSRGDTKNVCLLFNSLLPPGKTEKGERERRKNVSLFSKKTLSFSLSLSSKALSLSFFDILCFGCRFVFFFLSFRALLFVLGEIKSVGLLSLFFPFKGRSETTSKVCLSLSLTKRAFWKTRSPSRMLRRTQKERGMIISEKEDKLARESRKKKDGLDFSSHRAEQQPQRVVASKTKTHICVLPSVRPRGACLQNSFFLRCFNIYVCVYSVRSL